MPEWCECKNPRDSVTACGVERCCQCGLPIKFDPSEYANPAMRSTEEQMEWDVFNGWLFNALTEAGIEITNGPKLFQASEILFRKVVNAVSENQHTPRASKAQAWHLKPLAEQIWTLLVDDSGTVSPFQVVACTKENGLFAIESAVEGFLQSPSSSIAAAQKAEGATER